jgi:hypothetical protein
MPAFRGTALLVKWVPKSLELSETQAKWLKINWDSIPDFKYFEKKNLDSPYGPAFRDRTLSSR